MPRQFAPIVVVLVAGLVVGVAAAVAAVGAEAGKRGKNSASETPAGDKSAPAKVTKDLEYARVGDKSLKLDLYLPTRPIDQPPRLIVWVHGGAWRAGSKASMPLGGLVEKGWAVASVDYRLSTEAVFPAQVHDLKASIRFLRARQKELGFDATQVVIAGSSAGGHLAILVGVTNGNQELEGDLGEHRDQSSDVQAIVSQSGMSNLTTILSQSTPHGLDVRVPALQLLLGDQPDKKPELARLASPVFHVDAKDPPLLLMHGDQDNQAPVNQSLEMQGKYEEAKLPVELIIVHGVGHAAKEFNDAEHIEMIQSFLTRSMTRKKG